MVIYFSVSINKVLWGTGEGGVGAGQSFLCKGSIFNGDLLHRILLKHPLHCVSVNMGQ